MRPGFGPDSGEITHKRGWLAHRRADVCRSGRLCRPQRCQAGRSWVACPPSAASVAGTGASWRHGPRCRTAAGPLAGASCRGFASRSSPGSSRWWSSAGHRPRGGAAGWAAGWSGSWGGRSGSRVVGRAVGQSTGRTAGRSGGRSGEGSERIARGLVQELSSEARGGAGAHGSAPWRPRASSRRRMDEPSASFVRRPREISWASAAQSVGADGATYVCGGRCRSWTWR